MSPKATRQELELHIDQLEDSIAELKVQLRQLEEANQHEAIENLEVYLEAMEHRWEALREFWPIVQDELQDLFDRLKKDN